MAKTLGPKCRQCRREGMKLFLKGTRCDSPKCGYAKRDYPPGMHTWRRGKVSDYALQLREKQKAKRFYGIREKQFRRYFEVAERMPGNTGEALLRLLELRLDNVLVRANFSASRSESKQLVAHGHVTVNGKKVDICSYTCESGDIVGVRDRGTTVDRVKERVASLKSHQVPSWLQLQADVLQVKVLTEPSRDEVSLPLQEQLIVELCSR
jgi:small subunit ribosomal protein S4